MNCIAGNCSSAQPIEYDIGRARGACRNRSRRLSYISYFAARLAYKVCKTDIMFLGVTYAKEVVEAFFANIRPVQKCNM
jgi:hypothetical protein